MAESCELCGGAVEIRSTQEGTNHYVAVERGRIGTGDLVSLHAQVARLEGELAEAKGLPTDSEICQSCGSAVVLVWHAKDEDWEKVVGGPGGLRCARCFAAEAREEGIHLAFLAVPLEGRWTDPLEKFIAENLGDYLAVIERGVAAWQCYTSYVVGRYALIGVLSGQLAEEEDCVARLEGEKAALAAALRAMQKAAPQSMDTTDGHELWLANKQADAALSDAGEGWLEVK